MSTQFCKIGKRKIDLKHFLSLKELEETHHNFIEDAYSIKTTSASISSILDAEADKIKHLILASKRSHVIF